MCQMQMSSCHRKKGKYDGQPDRNHNEMQLQNKVSICIKRGVYQFPFSQSKQFTGNIVIIRKVFSKCHHFEGVEDFPHLCLSLYVCLT